MNLDVSVFNLELKYIAKFGNTYTARVARHVSKYASILEDAVSSGSVLTDSDFGLPMYSAGELV